ncbi:MAG: DNA recombination protein RmuC [Acidimicrobiales bacterium]
MEIALVLIAALGGAAIAGVAIARTMSAQLRTQGAAQLAAERDATIRAAVDSVVAVADQQLGQRAAAGARELDLRSQALNLKSAAIDEQLRDMGGQLQRVGDLVTTMQRERAEQHGQLAAGLAEAIRTTTDLAGSTQALRQALASPKARGQWGERMADDVLRAAGLLEGISYRKQTAIAGGTVPDVTFLLPQGKELHMDVKFPVDNYLRHLEAPSDLERDATRTQFLRDVRCRVKELAGRGYADPATTVGYLLLFIPNESVYAFIQEHDHAIMDLALEQRVVLCSPFTLFAVLGVIRQAVDTVQLERAGDEILDSLGRFGSQWTKLSECVDKLGKQLCAVTNTYDEIAGPRRRQLERRLDEIEAIRTQRGLPAPDVSDDEEPRLRPVSSL